LIFYWFILGSLLDKYVTNSYNSVPGLFCRQCRIFSWTLFWMKGWGDDIIIWMHGWAVVRSPLSAPYCSGLGNLGIPLKCFKVLCASLSCALSPRRSSRRPHSFILCHQRARFNILKNGETPHSSAPFNPASSWTNIKSDFDSLLNLFSSTYATLNLHILNFSCRRAYKDHGLGMHNSRVARGLHDSNPKVIEDAVFLGY